MRKTQPAVYMKICALLVPREMQIEHSGTIKQMSDEQIEQAIEAIQRMLEARAPGDQPPVIEGVAEPAALPAPARKTKRKQRKSDVRLAAGSEEEGANS